MSWHCLQASHTHDAIAEAAQLMKEAVDDIMVTLNEAASEVGMVSGMVESIAEAMGRVSNLMRGRHGWLKLMSGWRLFIWNELSLKMRMCLISPVDDRL